MSREHVGNVILTTPDRIKCPPVPGLHTRYEQADTDAELPSPPAPAALDAHTHTHTHTHRHMGSGIIMIFRL